MAKSKPKLYPCHCNQCGYDWQSKKKHPKHCASCISDKWDKALVGKKLRKAVPSRAGRKLSPKNVADLKKRMKVERASSKVKAPQARKKRMDAEPIIGVLVKPKEPKVKAPRAPRVKNSALDKSDVENAPGAHGVFPKKVRVPRVKKEKPTPAAFGEVFEKAAIKTPRGKKEKGTPTPEQFDKKATEA